eukprot:5958614-Prymnesium_polylepis.1
MLICLVAHAAALSPKGTQTTCSRRCAVGHAVLAPLALLPAERVAAATNLDALSARLEATVLKEPDIKPTADAPSLPAWLVGRWECTSTLQACSTPLGVQFIGAPGRPPSEAEATAAQTRAQVGKPVTLELRWLEDGKGGAVENRPFNVRSRLDAFAGRQVVRASEAC